MLDLAPDAAAVLVARHPGSVAVSAVTGEGIDASLGAMSGRLRVLSRVVELMVLKS